VTAAIAKDHVMATQYHPEKSGSEGLQMIRNFVQYVATCKASLMMHS
jgi:glutamine amidotransferase